MLKGSGLSTPLSPISLPFRVLGTHTKPSVFSKLPVQDSKWAAGHVGSIFLNHHVTAGPLLVLKHYNGGGI